VGVFSEHSVNRSVTIRGTVACLRSHFASASCSTRCDFLLEIKMPKERGQE